MGISGIQAYSQAKIGKKAGKQVADTLVASRQNCMQTCSRQTGGRQTGSRQTGSRQTCSKIDRQQESR